MSDGIKKLSPQERKEKDQAFRIFKRKLGMIGRLKPRARYLYPVMDSVPYQDLETTLDSVIVDFGEKVQQLRELQGGQDSEATEQIPENTKTRS